MNPMFNKKGVTPLGFLFLMLTLILLSYIVGTFIFKEDKFDAGFTDGGSIINIDVTDPIFGAIPNDSISDKEAFQKAIDFCLRMIIENPEQRVGFRLYIPSGRYLLDPDSVIGR